MPPKKQLKLCTICGQAEATQKKHKVCSAVLCLEEFNSRPRWSTRSCPQCGSEYQNDKWNPRQTCGVECRNKVRGSAREKVCPVCTTDFRADRPEQVYCSQGCFGKAHSGRGSKGGRVPLCICGQPVQSKSRVFCSDECQQANQRTRPRSKPDTEHVCLACGSDFTRPWYYAGKKLYCSAQCQKFSIQKESIGQAEVKALVEGMEVTVKDFRLPSGKEVDVYCPESQVGFEYNGAYFHSIKGLEWRGVKKSNQIQYHLSKTLEAESNGIFIYHIWSWEWEDKHVRPIVESQIRNLLGKMDRRVAARSTDFSQIDNAVAGSFLDDHHLMGRVNAYVHYGLHHDDELVAVMSFDPKGEEGEWLLSRYCVKRGVSVIGGASKLFARFVRAHDPERVVSYSDRAKTSGGMYETLGFSVMHTTDPEYVNFHPSSGKVYRRYQTMRKALLAKHPDELDDSMSERQMCDALGYTRIYGCGKKAWAWSKPATAGQSHVKANSKHQHS